MLQAKPDAALVFRVPQPCWIARLEPRVYLGLRCSGAHCLDNFEAQRRRVFFWAVAKGVTLFQEQIWHLDGQTTGHLKVSSIYVAARQKRPCPTQ